jgi:hypothetical protein
MLHIIPISGKDSLATALVQKAHHPNLDYIFFVNAVGKELPPFWDWIETAEAALGAKIEVIESNLAEITQAKGILPSPSVRFCTREAKIKPMEQWLADVDGAIIYYGLRADEESRQGYNDNNRISARYPLREHGLDIWAVWTILESKGLLPPTFLFPEVENAVKEIMGGDFEVTKRLRPWHYAQLFGGRSRQFNCFDCFYMRRYEWAYMLLHWPDYFWRAVEIEETTGAEDYTLIKGYPLRRFQDTYQNVIHRRADSVASTLYKLAQLNVFEEMPEELGLTSCGMFCGK